MKNLFIKIFVNDEAKPEMNIEDRPEVRKFYEANKNQWVEWFLRTPEEVRRLKANRYLWGGVYREFVPAHFQTVDDVHEHYTEKFLTNHDELDLDDPNFLTELNRIQKYARRIIKYQTVDSIVSLEWVRSTTTLTKKMFSEYTSQVMLDGQEHGIEFKQIEEFDEYKNT